MSVIVAALLLFQALPPLVGPLVPETGGRVAGIVRRSVADELGLPANVIVAAGGGDTATSALGVGAAESGDGFLSLGTSGVLSVVTGQFRPSPHLGVHALCHAIPNRCTEQASCCLRLAAFAGYAISLRRTKNVC